MAFNKLTAGTKGNPNNSTGPQIATAVNQLVDAASQIWIPATRFTFANGEASTGYVGGRFPAWTMKHTTDDQINAMFVPVDGWQSYDISLYWTNVGANTGDVRLSVSVGTVVDGGDVQATDTDYNLTVAAPAQRILKVTDITSSNSLAASGLGYVAIQRVGTNVADTLNNEIAVLGVMLKRKV